MGTTEDPREWQKELGLDRSEYHPGARRENPLSSRTASRQGKRTYQGYQYEQTRDVGDDDRPDARNDQDSDTGTQQGREPSQLKEALSEWKERGGQIFQFTYVPVFGRKVLLNRGPGAFLLSFAYGFVAAFIASIFMVHQGYTALIVAGFLWSIHLPVVQKKGRSRALPIWIVTGVLLLLNVLISWASAL